MTTMTAATHACGTHTHACHRAHDLWSNIIIKSLVPQHRAKNSKKKSTLAPLNWHLPHANTHNLNNIAVGSRFLRLLLTNVLKRARSKIKQRSQGTRHPVWAIFFQIHFSSRLFTHCLLKTQTKEWRCRAAVTRKDARMDGVQSCRTIKKG